MSTSNTAKPWRVISYIDGFNLFYGLCDAGLQSCLWLDVQRLSASILRPGCQLVRTKYFTARISNDPPKERRQVTFLEALGTLRDFEIFYGHFLPKSVTCFNCRYTFRVYEEKMSDVNLANELLADAFQGQFDTALVISADSDLAAPIKTVRRLFPEKRVIVATPPKRHSNELKNLAEVFGRWWSVSRRSNK